MSRYPHPFKNLQECILFLLNISSYLPIFFKDNDNGMAGLETTTTSTRNKLNVNLYATKKTVAQGMLDIALLTANVAQLKYVLLTKGSHQFYTSMMWFISISIVLQVSYFLLSNEMKLDVQQTCAKGVHFFL